MCGHKRSHFKVENVRSKMYEITAGMYQGNMLSAMRAMLYSIFPFDSPNFTSI